MYKNAVAIGDQRYNVEDNQHYLKYFDTLTEAKRYAKNRYNASVYRLYYDNTSGDLINVREFHK